MMTRMSYHLSKQMLLKSYRKEDAVELRKFNSNVDTLGDGEASQQICGVFAEALKILGVFWHPKEDTLSYADVDLCDDKPATKRTILAQTVKLCDPLRLLAPIIIVAKLMIQELWQAKLNWDDSVPQQL